MYLLPFVLIHALYKLCNHLWREVVSQLQLILRIVKCVILRIVESVTAVIVNSLAVNCGTGAVSVTVVVVIVCFIVISL